MNPQLLVDDPYKYVQLTLVRSLKSTPRTAASNQLRSCGNKHQADAARAAVYDETYDATGQPIGQTRITAVVLVVEEEAAIASFDGEQETK